MAPIDTKPEYVIATRPSNVTGEEVLITNKGNAWVKGYNNSTGAKNAVVLNGKFIIYK